MSAPATSIHHMPLQQRQPQRRQPDTLVILALLSPRQHPVHPLPQHAPPHLVNAAHSSGFGNLEGLGRAISTATCSSTTRSVRSTRSRSRCPTSTNRPASSRCSSGVALPSMMRIASGATSLLTRARSASSSRSSRIMSVPAARISGHQRRPAGGCPGWRCLPSRHHLRLVRYPGQPRHPCPATPLPRSAHWGAPSAEAQSSRTDACRHPWGCRRVRQPGAGACDKPRAWHGAWGRA